MRAVKSWRQEGLEVYFTLNTGQDIHLICEGKDNDEVVQKAGEIPDVTKTIVNYPSRGARIVSADPS